MFEEKRITLVMPVLNEVDGLSAVLKSVPGYIDETIIVDNGSIDGSVAVAESFDIRLIHQPIRGYGSAITAGVLQSQGDVVIISDADCTYPIDKIGEILAFMQRGSFDFVSGSRFPLDNAKAMPRLNLIANHFVSWLARILFRVSICDLESGFMFFNRDMFKVTGIESLGMEFSQEFKIRAWLSGRKCAEIHIPYNARMGKTKFRKIKDVARNFINLIKLTQRLKKLPVHG